MDPVTRVFLPDDGASPEDIVATSDRLWVSTGKGQAWSRSIRAAEGGRREARQRS